MNGKTWKLGAMDAKFGIIGLVVCVLCSLGLGPRAAWAVPTPTSDPFTSIEGNMRYQVGELQGRTPQGTPSSWRTARQALDLGTHTLAYTGIPLAQAHDRIHALSKQNLLAWEAALIAQTHAAGGLSADLAAAWVRFLSTWDALPEAERIQQHTALRLRLIGGALASLAPACMPTEMPAAEYVAALAQIETGTPGRRLRSRMEPPPVLPERPSAHGLTQVSEDARDAALALIALLSPSTPSLASIGLNLNVKKSNCAHDYAQTLFILMLDPQADGARVFERLAAQSEAFPVASLWLWRLAVHRYLMGDTQGVRRITNYYTKYYPSSATAVEMMSVLSDIAGDAPSKARENWPAADTGSNPTYQWICAEAARRRGLVGAAATSLARVVDDDVHFVAAWISLAAARSALSQGHGVHVALQTLEDIAPPLPIYDYWRATLRARTTSE